VRRLVLDSDVIIALEQAGAEIRSDVGRVLPLVVTDVVWDELEAPGDRQHRAQAFATAIAGHVTVLQANSPEAGTWAALQSDPRTEGAGEHSVIAYCVHHPDSIGVFQDKAALRRAVEELRGRVLSFHGLIGELVDGGHLSWERARAVASRYRRQFTHARPPLWWPAIPP